MPIFGAVLSRRIGVPASLAGGVSLGGSSCKARSFHLRQGFPPAKNPISTILVNRGRSLLRLPVLEKPSSRSSREETKTSKKNHRNQNAHSERNHAASLVSTTLCPAADPAQQTEKTNQNRTLTRHTTPIASVLNTPKESGESPQMQEWCKHPRRRAPCDGSIRCGHPPRLFFTVSQHLFSFGNCRDFLYSC